MGRVGVHLRGAAGSLPGAGDGERASSGAARGRTCVPQGLAEAWTLRSG